mmetsp:Transcript_18824/g.41708  ORF Transcript_18824/g.41708 Transcript_18824/m.41708 type:complete len:209 (+) Transcript_18824:622-1248(+)
MQRSHQRLGVGEALLPCHILVVAPGEPTLQLHNLTIPIPRRRGAHSILLAANSVIVSYKDVPVIQALRILLFELLHAATAVRPLGLHTLQSGLCLRFISCKELLVLGIAGDNLPEDGKDKQLVRSMRLQDSRFNNALHHLLQLLHGGIHSRRHLPRGLDLLLHSGELLLQGSHRAVDVGRHVHSHSGGHSDGRTSTHKEPKKRKRKKG